MLHLLYEINTSDYAWINKDIMVLVAPVVNQNLAHQAFMNNYYNTRIPFPGGRCGYIRTALNLVQPTADMDAYGVHYHGWDGV